jgi:cell surface protein SprA
MGVNVEHKISDNFGATFLKCLRDRFTQKSSFGKSQLTILFFGFNTNFSSEVPFLTMVANVDTDVPSNLSVEKCFKTGFTKGRSV